MLPELEAVGQSESDRASDSAAIENHAAVPQTGKLRDEVPYGLHVGLQKEKCRPRPHYAAHENPDCKVLDDLFGNSLQLRQPAGHGDASQKGDEKHEAVGG